MELLQGVPSRISTIFYFGLEGLGGLEMETDEDENVCVGLPDFQGQCALIRKTLEGR